MDEPEELLERRKLRALLRRRGGISRRGRPSLTLGLIALLLGIAAIALVGNAIASSGLWADSFSLAAS